MRRVVCPGSFDPVTNGHLDIISRAARLSDEVVVAVVRNPSKTALFTLDERLEMLREVTKEQDNVSVVKFDGLIVDFCKANDISAIVKGLRAVSDFDYELQMAQMNYNQAGVETLFMTTNPLYAFLSSSLVKEFAMYGGDVTEPGAGTGAGPAHRPLGGRASDETQPGGAQADLGFPQAARYADRPIPHQHPACHATRESQRTPSGWTRVCRWSSIPGPSAWSTCGR